MDPMNRWLKGGWLQRGGLFAAIAKFCSAQIVVQGLGFIAGILTVRLLVPGEYALYTLANSLLGALCVLADSGITSGAMSQGGKVWKNPVALGQVLATSLSLRRLFAFGSASTVLPLLIWMSRSHGASWPESLMLAMLVAALFTLAIGNSIYEVAPKLHQQVGSLGRIRSVSNLGRILLMLGMAGFWSQAGMALFAALIPQLWANRALKKLGKSTVDWSQQPNAAMRGETLRIVKRVLPGSIYYCLSGQLAVILISVFGSTIALAQVGAVGRFSQIMTLLSAVGTVVFVPRFARIQNNRRILPAFLGVMGGTAGVCALVLALVFVFEKQALWILGSAYEGLRAELLLAVCASGISLLTGLAYAMGASRGWIANPWVSISLCGAAQVLLITTLDLSSARGVLTLNLLAATVPFLVQFVYNLHRSIGASRTTTAHS